MTAVDSPDAEQGCADLRSPVLRSCSKSLDIRPDSCLNGLMPAGGSAPGRTQKEKAVVDEHHSLLA